MTTIVRQRTWREQIQAQLAALETHLAAVETAPAPAQWAECAAALTAGCAAATLAERDLARLDPAALSTDLAAALTRTIWIAFDVWLVFPPDTPEARQMARALLREAGPSPRPGPPGWPRRRGCYEPICRPARADRDRYLRRLRPGRGPARAARMHPVRRAMLHHLRAAARPRGLPDLHRTLPLPVRQPQRSAPTGLRHVWPAHVPALPGR